MAEEPTTQTTPEAPTAPEVPAWVPEKFKDDPPKFGESYANLEREFTSRSQELSELRQTVEELKTQATQPQVDPDEYADQLRQAYDDDPLAVTAQLVNRGIELGLGRFMEQFQAQQGPMVEQQYALQAIEAERLVAADPNFGDYDALRPKIGETLERYRGLIPENASLEQMAEGIKAAYGIALADELRARAVAQPAAQPQPQVPQPDPGLLARSQVATLAGGGVRPAPSDPGETRWSDIQNAQTTSYAGLAS